jgi:hypothetical protein
MKYTRESSTRLVIILHSLNHSSVWILQTISVPVVMPLDGRMFYFTSGTTVRQLLEILLKEIKVLKG